MYVECCIVFDDMFLFWNLIFFSLITFFFFKPFEPPKEDKLEDKRQNGGHGGQIGPMEDVLLNGGQLCTMDVVEAKKKKNRPSIVPKVWKHPDLLP